MGYLFHRTFGHLIWGFRETCVEVEMMGFGKN